MSRKIAVYKYRVERKICHDFLNALCTNACEDWPMYWCIQVAESWNFVTCTTDTYRPLRAPVTARALCVPLFARCRGLYVRLDTSAQRKTVQWGRWRSGRTRQSPSGCAASSSILSGRSEAQTRQFWVFTAPFWWLVCFVAEDDATQEVWTSLGFLLHPLGKHRSLVHITFTQRLVHSVVVGI